MACCSLKPAQRGRNISEMVQTDRVMLIQQICAVNKSLAVSDLPRPADSDQDYDRPSSLHHRISFNTSWEIASAIHVSRLGVAEHPADPGIWTCLSLQPLSEAHPRQSSVQPRGRHLLDLFDERADLYIGQALGRSHRERNLRRRLTRE